MKKSPNDGGCWFCFEDSGPMVAESEFDCWVHLECVRKALDADPEHPEAQFMDYLLEERKL